MDDGAQKTPNPAELGGVTGFGADSQENTVGASDGDSTAFVAEYRAKRFSTQRAIALICRADALARGYEFASDRYRIVACLWCAAGDVHVLQSRDNGRAHYKGLQTCGSVWMCPCCASKIEERRRREIVQVFEWADREHLDSSMITNTFSHGQGDDLRELFKLQAIALARYRQSKGYRSEMKRIGYVSLVRSLEITHGRNGFHPHTHEVQFHRERLNEDDARWMRHRLVEIWMKACEKAGLFKPETDNHSVFYQRAIDVRAHFTAGDYLAKHDDAKAWTPAHEIAKSSSKQGRRSGVHPFQLATRGHPRDAELFLEYANATKGKRKLFFSRGLKAKVGLQEKSDEQLASEEIDAASLVAALPPVVWNFIRQTDRLHNTRAAVLDAAETNGKDGIAELLHRLGFDPYALANNQ